MRIRKRGSSKSVTTYAFYDNGSGGSFITENLQNQLGVKGVKTALKLGTMHGRSYISSNVLTNLVVTDLSDDNPIEINKVFTREFIPVDHDQIPTPEIASKWNHLESVAKDIPGPNLTNTLTGVLTRFRQDPIGFMADIEAMFYQVRVPVSQRNYLRFYGGQTVI